MPSPPTAMVCSDDEVAIDIMRALRERGVGTPEDMALVDLDDLPVAEFAKVPLTAVRHPTSEIGRLAAVLLLEDIGGDEPGPPRMKVPQPELVVRKSGGSGSVNAKSPNLEELGK